MNVSSSLLSHYSRETNSTLYLGSNSFSLYHRKCLYRCLDSEISRCSFFIQHIGRKHETIIQSSNTNFKFTGIFELFRNNTKLNVDNVGIKGFRKIFLGFFKVISPCRNSPLNVILRQLPVVFNFATKPIEYLQKFCSNWSA